MRRNLGFFLLALLVCSPVQAATLDPKELVRRIETQYQAGTSHGIAKMTIVTAHYTRELRLEVWGRGRDDMLARILTPAKEAGISTLKVGDEIWNYLPRIDKLMKVPSGLMGEGWMGSHFTNDDLVKENKIDELYTFTVAYSDDTTAVITGTPKPNAAVVWGRIEYVLNHVQLTPIRVDYYDEDGVKARQSRFSDIRTVSGRQIPMRSTIEPLDKKGERTEFMYESLEFDVKLDPQQFSLQNLRRR
jgi:outer membrane lipoprotein-sorting protein